MAAGLLGGLIRRRAKPRKRETFTCREQTGNRQLHELPRRLGPNLLIGIRSAMSLRSTNWALYLLLHGRHLLLLLETVCSPRSTMIYF
jgi:hypothetical protein